MKKITRKKRAPNEREIIMEKVFQGALAVIAKHKAAQLENANGHDDKNRPARRR